MSFYVPNTKNLLLLCHFIRLVKTIKADNKLFSSKEHTFITPAPIVYFCLRNNATSTMAMWYKLNRNLRHRGHFVGMLSIPLKIKCILYMTVKIQFSLEIFETLNSTNTKYEKFLNSVFNSLCIHITEYFTRCKNVLTLRGLYGDTTPRRTLDRPTFLNEQEWSVRLYIHRHVFAQRRTLLSMVCVGFAIQCLIKKSLHFK